MWAYAVWNSIRFLFCRQNGKELEKRTKKIVILTCLKSVDYCTGAACLTAFNCGSGAFRQYQNEELELAAFCHCNGCASIVAQDQGMQEKIERILKIHPDAVHLGVCTLHKETGKRCETINTLVNIFRDNGISVVDGTHNSSRLPDIGRRIV